MPQRINLNNVLRAPGNVDDLECNGALIVQGAAQGSAVQPATALVLTGSGTITPTAPVYRLNPSSAVAGIVMAAGTYTGQRVSLVNTSAFSVTFAAVGTSNVADGVSAVIAPLTDMTLVWDSVGLKWYHENGVVAATSALTVLGLTSEIVAGAGTTQGTAAALSVTKVVHQITGANGTVGWILPATTVVGTTHIMLNTTAGVALIYPATGGTMNGGSANAAFTALTGIKPIIAIASAADTWSIA